MTSSALSVDASKDSSGENFPVGSTLLPKAMRPHVARFYAFAREADDIADSNLPPQEKINRLARYAETVSTGRGPVQSALRLHLSLKETGVTDRHALDLISAFQQDAVKPRYASWGELMDYCDRSAAPVGRFLIDLHGEDASLYGASDMLCRALQVINHLQDCGKDFREMDRVYLPQDWMDSFGATDQMLAAPQSAGRLKLVLRRCVDETRALMLRAQPLSDQCRSKRFGAECAVIVALANRLVEQLSHRDPLAERVVLPKPVMMWTALKAVGRHVF